MPQIIHEVKATDKDQPKVSDRRTVTCPDCHMDYTCLVIDTDKGWFFDMVDCEGCGAELVPPKEVTDLLTYLDSLQKQYTGQMIADLIETVDQRNC